MVISFWELALYGMAAYVAIATLVHMMRTRRDALIDELTWKANAMGRQPPVDAGAESDRDVRNADRQEGAKQPTANSPVTNSQTPRSRRAA